MYEAAFASSSQRAEDGGACSQSTRAARFAPSLVAQCDLLPRTFEVSVDANILYGHVLRLYLYHAPRHPSPRLALQARSNSFNQRLTPAHSRLTPGSRYKRPLPFCFSTSPHSYYHGSRTSVNFAAV